uniref:Uncharacterized protein n=1 Tax=Setaria italica TaxID=4555 RepID=K3YWT5_SETIT
MVQQQPQPATSSGILDAVPLFVVVLLAVHVLALVRILLASCPFFVSPPPRARTLRRLILARSRLLSALPAGYRCSGCTSWPPRSSRRGGRRSDARRSTQSLACLFGGLDFRTEVMLQKV